MIPEWLGLRFRVFPEEFPAHSEGSRGSRLEPSVAR